MLSDGEISYLYDGFGRFEQVTKADGSITHVINGEEKESGELPQEDVQSRVLNYYEYDAFGNTIRCEEQVHNRFRYTGEQYDPLTGQYYLRARYYNPVIARFTQEDTYYGDGLNLYTYCQNNPILNHDPTGHGTKENSPYSRKEQQYIDAGADPDTARLAAECYPDAKLKQDLYNKYKKQGYSAQDAKKLANREIIHGEEATKKYIKDNNVKKSGPDYTATSPRDNVNTDWRTQERLNAQRNAGAGKGNESGNKSGTATINPNDIRFSQSSVNGASEIIDSMKAKGWDGDPIDVVRMPDGNLTTIDNTRVLAARYAEIDVQANVHAFDEVLPQDLDLIERLTTPKGVPQTWGDAVLLRIGKQNSGYRNTYPLGSNIIGWSGN